MELELLRVGLGSGVHAKSYSGCREAVKFVLVWHLQVCEDDTEIQFLFYFSLFIEIFMPALSHFCFLTHSFSFANPLPSLFSVFVIPEGKDNTTNTLGLIFPGLVIFHLPVSPRRILYPCQVTAKKLQQRDWVKVCSGSGNIGESQVFCLLQDEYKASDWHIRSSVGYFWSFSPWDNSYFSLWCFQGANSLIRVGGKSGIPAECCCAGDTWQMCLELIARTHIFVLKLKNFGFVKGLVFWVFFLFDCLLLKEMLK